MNTRHHISGTEPACFQRINPHHLILCEPVLQRLTRIADLEFPFRNALGYETELRPRMLQKIGKAGSRLGRRPVLLLLGGKRGPALGKLRRQLRALVDGRIVGDIIVDGVDGIA